MKINKTPLFFCVNKLSLHICPVNLHPDIKNIRLHQPYFFQGLDHIFSPCNLQSKTEEARLPLLFLNDKKKIQTLFF